MEERINKFKELIKKSNKIVFFGGAGVSTESGVKDYRSEDGLYNTVKEYGCSPENILSHTFLYNNTETFYDFFYKYFLSCQALPNAAHYALAKLEEMGKLTAVITQNIDGLHQKAGSKNVLELHGSGESFYCSRCGAAYPGDEVVALGGGVPKCKKCSGFVRPDVVMYQEGLNESTVEMTIKAIREADLLIIGGTSLAVYPAASFLGYFKGDNIVLINHGETAYDSLANLVFRESIGQVLSAVVNTLK